jgi:hypothetical protein
MRRFIAAVLVFGAFVCPTEVDALDCPVLLGSHLFQAADGVEAPAERQSQDLEARAVLARLELTPIVFRGRLASARYLSDLRKTNTPYSLLVFDRVEVLKGRLPKASIDRKAFILQQEWCDHSCGDRKAARWWPRDKAAVVAVEPNEFVDPSKAVDPVSKRVIYNGRIDAVRGMCGGGPLTPAALELLNASTTKLPASSVNIRRAAATSPACSPAPVKDYRAPPLLGADTNDVLAMIGHDEAKLETLKAPPSGVAGRATARPNVRSGMTTHRRPCERRDP